MTGRPRAPSTPSGSAGTLLELIRRGDATTKPDLVELTGLARSTVSQRVDLLISEGYVIVTGETRSTGGRPPMALEFNRDLGVVLAADIGATHSRFAVCDLNAEPLAEMSVDLLVGDGPDSVLGRAEDAFESLLSEADRTSNDVLGVGVGVPGPVDFFAGRAVHPPIMFGWHDYPIRDRLADRFSAPTLVDNDVNIMALGEHWTLDEPVDDLLYVKVGTGIGSGLILGGHLHRGARGAAGDIGHIQAGATDVVCRCGNTGCLEASAGGAALALQLAELGYETTNSRDVVELVAEGNQDALHALREAGRLLGEALSSIVNLLNPGLLLIGGDLAQPGQTLVAAVREVVYQRSLPLSTADLRIQESPLGDRAGVVGAAALVLDHILHADAVDASIRRPRRTVSA
ncbi:MAG: ROK family transcriptional regulator [Actinomycetota bacterium]|nr:ROK family transcriptional regulator [Actinomycetota bacterium]MDK1102807.1 ROK family transcriptional regulator [Actinomycetota bacterium]